MLTTKEAARRLGFTPQTLRLWRSQDRGPAYVQTEGGGVRYRRSDLEAWIEQRRVTTRDQRCKGSRSQ
jgi:excisionase family DNA binding protein